MLTREEMLQVSRRQSSVKRIDKGAASRARALAGMPDDVLLLARSFLSLREAAEARKIGWVQSFQEDRPSSLYLRVKRAPLRFSRHERGEVPGRAELALDVCVPLGLSRSAADALLDDCLNTFSLGA